MSSVSSTSPGLQNLLQTLSSLNSPVLSSSPVTSALKKAPTADIVQISVAATQLQGVDAMFGIADSTGSSASTVLTNLENLASGTTGASTATTASSQSATSSADQLAGAEAALQAQQTQGLFGSGTTSGVTGSGR